MHMYLHRVYGSLYMLLRRVKKKDYYAILQLAHKVSIYLQKVASKDTSSFR